jgi:oxalate decarboxylase/phosphoglucose isomerase-like protein (cupin superfamily)
MVIEVKDLAFKRRDFRGAKGDILYAAPWDVHGIKNTGNASLSFVVWKWNNKGVAPPPMRSSENNK